MTLQSPLSFPASDGAVAALDPDAAAPHACDAAGAPGPLDPRALAITPRDLHELRDLLAPVVQCAAILRMSSARSARLDRTSEILARNVRAVRQLLDELDAARAPRRHLHRS